MLKHILLIGDDASEATAACGSLLRSDDAQFRVEWVRSCAEGLERLKAQAGQRQSGKPGIAAILTDLFLPDSQGIATFDVLFAAAPQVPILVFVTPDDEALARLAMQRGAQDYLFKGSLNDYLLPKTLRSMIDGAANADALFIEKARAEATLSSIGDAVMSTDEWGNVTYLNGVAEHLTGWARAEAVGSALEEVFHIVDATTREAVVNPMMLAIYENRSVGLTANCILIRRDGAETRIEDSAAPIYDRFGLVTGAVMVFHDVSTARALSTRMSYLAQYDGLTELPNRTLFNDRLAQALTMARRNDKKLALLYLDIDRFKHINESLGQPVGDRLLQSVSKRLLACVRATDTVSRPGGDEFLVLLAGIANPEAAATIAEKMLASLKAPHRVEHNTLHITASIGVVTFPDDGKDAATLLKNADFAMYQAKACGRDNYQFFNSSLNLNALERQVLEGDLRRALERHEFVLYFQPNMDLATGAVSGFEALLRWHHPKRALLAPAQFMAIAEESGLIVPIGRWVLRESCRQARAWQHAGLPPIRVAVNISAVELRGRDFVESVKTILTETGLEPNLLELELTETFLKQDSVVTLLVLRELKALGVRLALGDFGTGYSSPSYLKRFPIDTLKIKQSFVHDQVTDQDDANIVSAVIGIGKSLHLRVVAEGVETREQCELLKAHRCPEAQGYYFGEPLTASDFFEFMGRQPEAARAALG